MPQPAAQRDRGSVRRDVRDIIDKCRPWVLRLGILALLAAGGVVGMNIIDSSGLKAKVLADLAGVCSEEVGAGSLLNEHPRTSVKSLSSVTVCEKLVNLKPGDVHARVLLANAYADVGRTHEALACYSAVLAADPNCFEAHLGMGKMHFVRGSYADAAASYRRALQIRPRSADAHLALGLALSNAGKCEEAMQAFQKAKELDPTLVETQVMTGQAYLKAGMYAQAIECFKGAVQTDEQHAQAYYNLGRAYLRVGDKGLALEQQHILQNLDAGLADQLLDLISQ